VRSGRQRVGWNSARRGPLGQQAACGVAGHAPATEVVEQDLDPPADELGGQRVDRVLRSPGVEVVPAETLADQLGQRQQGGRLNRGRLNRGSGLDVGVLLHAD